MLADQIYSLSKWQEKETSKNIQTKPNNCQKMHSMTQKTSLLPTPDNSIPTQSFTNIKQGIHKSSTKFVDQLKFALEKQIENPVVWKEVLNKIAMVNANQEWKFS